MNRSSMEKIEKPEIESLIRIQTWPAVSMYMPVSRIGDPQDPLRYKNFLTQVEARLIDEGLRTTEARLFLESEFDLVKDIGFWKQLGADGLAVFLSSEALFRYPLPVPFPELVMVGRRFHIRPLLPLLPERRYMILALSRNRLQLFEGDRYRFKERELPDGTPTSMDEALQYERERSLQFHSRTTSATNGRRPAMFHGHGAGADDQDEELERYYQIVDRCLFPLLEDCPVILAGTEEQHAVYRRVTRSRTILPQGISGNVGEFSNDTLRNRSWAIANEFFSKEEGEAVADFLDNLGGGRVAGDLPSVLTAAYDGRVENLFVAENELVFGLFAPDRREVTVKDREDGKSIELLDEAVYWTLQQKGTVYIRTRQEMPVDTTICARLRY